MLSVVLPVRDGGDLVGPAVRALVAAAEARGGEVIVVDDASTDDTATVAAAAGACVLTASTPAGPYAARNRGWRRAGHEVVAFVDVRCRPRPGWVDALLEPFADPDVALVGGDVVVADGPTAAAHAAHHLQPLRLRADAPFLPYAPTCHLAVRRPVLERAGGFAEVRGGGDVNLCWTVQHAGLGAFRAAPGAVLDWVPRPHRRDLREQYHRYGRNYGRLAAAWARAGCPSPEPASPPRAALHELRPGPARDAGWAVATTVAACRAAFARGLRQGLSDPDPRLGP